MFTKILNMVTQSVVSCIDWLDSVFGAIGTEVLVTVLASFLIYTAVRLLLKPFLGYASSDLATRGLKDKNRQKQQAQRQAQRQQTTKKGGK